MITYEKVAYRGYWIVYDPKPIPASCGVDWSFWHDDYDPTPWHADDGPSDNRAGNEASLEACKAAIDEQIEEQEERQKERAQTALHQHQR